MHEYTKMQIPSKRYLTNTAHTFRGTCSASALRYLGVNHFCRYRTKIYGKVEVCLIKLVRLRMRSQHRVFPCSYWPREGFRKIRRIQTIQRGFHSESMEVFREPCATSSPDEEFLHAKIHNKDVYVNHGATEDIPEDACSLRQYGKRFDNIELK